MYLKSLTLKGFKSFADKSTLVLEPGITAIVGPNGSGKSNISDAVLWVLGERNARNLRGQAMEDVIFAGSSSRKAVNVAEVQLVLDNSDGTLPVDYTEVSIGRRMYRSGESEYLINGVASRRMDVLEILHDSGLGTGTHSIISQGHLDSILESKPEDRRALIEEAAGVLKHKQRKQKSQRKLERMDQHLMRVQDIANEVERQLKPLERKAKRAVTYQQLTDELSDLTLQLAVDDLRALQVKWDDVLTRESELRGQISKLNDESFAADSKVREMQRQLSEQAEGSRKTEGSFHAMRTAAERIESTLRVLREKKRSLLRSREEKIRDLDANRLRIQDLTDELAEAEDQELQVEVDLKLAQDKQREKKAALTSLSSRLDACEREIRALEKQERSLEARLEALRNKQMQMSAAYQESMADSKLVEERQSGLSQQLAEAKTREEALVAEWDASQASLAELQQRELAARNETVAALDAVEEARSELSAAQEQKSVADGAASALEAAQAARASENKMRSHAVSAGSELGPWQDLVSAVDVPSELQDVVESLLGEAIDALLVSDTSQAEALMAGLCGQDLPGSVYVVPPCAAEAPQIPSAHRLISELSYEDGVAGSVEALLGHVYLTDTFQEAFSLWRAHASSGLTVASRDGLVISGRGVCSVTVRDSSVASPVEQHRRLVEAQKRSEEAGQVRDAAQVKLSEAEAALVQAQKLSLQLASELAAAKGQDKSLAEKLQDCRKTVANLESQMRELQEKREQARLALEKLQPSRDMVEADLQKASDDLVSVKSSLAQMREGEGPLRSSLQDAQTSFNEAKLSVATLTERKTYATRVTFGRKQTLDTLKGRIARAETYLNKSSDAPHAIDELLQDFEALHSSLMSWVGRLSDTIEKSRNEAATANRQIDEARKVSRELHGKLDAANDRMSDIRVEKGRLEVQVENATATIVRDCDVPLEVALSCDKVDDRAAAESRADQLRKRISGMGPINPDAARDYEELKERYDFLTGQIQDMMTARKSLEKIVRIIDERMRKDFIDTFHQVNEGFQRIFGELFPGGTACLRLCDESDLEATGIDIEAQPLGKKVAKTSLMSGGEKSLIAMALLMAVYQVRSTPFYILDEVEAALDDTNLRRLCTCLDTMRQDTQLLIITHQRRTMEMADVLYGISMQGGATKLVSQRLDREKIGKEG